MTFRRCGTIFHNSLRQIQLANYVRHSSSEANARREKGINGHYDVVIVGGGPAGLSMACAFGKYHSNIMLSVFVTNYFLTAKNPKLTEKRVLLLDGGPSFKCYSPDSFSNRVYALNQSTIDLLTSLDAWSTITNIRHQPVKRMQVIMKLFLYFFFCLLKLKPIKLFSNLDLGFLFGRNDNLSRRQFSG